MSILKSVKRIIRITLYLPFSLRDALYCWSGGIQWHHSWRFWKLPRIKKCRGGSLSIGKRFVACSDLAHNPLGATQPVIIYVRSGGKLEIGDNFGITGSSIVCFEHISIGNNVIIGPGCSIIDTDGHSINPSERRNGSASASPIIIENDVFIGTKCIILKGVRIGEGSIIAAGAVVMDTVPPFSIYAGNPAQKYRRKKSMEVRS